MKEIFEKYITNIVELTFGFTPKVRIELWGDEMIKVFLDGNEFQRRQMMGYNAYNLRAMKQLLVIFSMRHKIFVSLNIEFPPEKDIEY